MTRSVYRYNFSRLVPMDQVEAPLMLAALAAESLHGRSAMKIEASFRLNKRARTCIIDAGSRVGHDIARIFAGFLAAIFSEGAFCVERAEDGIPASSNLYAAGVVG